MYDGANKEEDGSVLVDVPCDSAFSGSSDLSPDPDLSARYSSTSIDLRHEDETTSSGSIYAPSTSSAQSSSTDSKKKSTRKVKLMERFIDSVSPTEIEEITKNLARFFYACNIPFSVVDSDHFKKFVKSIRPAYAAQVPNRKALSSSLLNEVYNDLVAELKETSLPDSTLLIDGWKNENSNKKTVTTMISNVDGAHLFLDAWDISSEAETGEKLNEIVEEAKTKAKEMYNTDLYSVVSDNASNMLKMGRLSDLWHSSCNAHTGNLLAKDLVSKELNQQLLSIIKEFRRPEITDALLKKGGVRVVMPIEIRWKSYRDSYKNFLRNAQFMREIACDKVLGRKMDEEVRSLILDNDFYERVEDFVNLFNPVCDLIDESQKKDKSAAEAVDLWLGLEMPEKFPELQLEIEKRRSMALKNVCALAAYTLHPKFASMADIRLSTAQKEDIQDFFLNELDLDGLSELAMFQERRGFFSKLFLKNIEDPIVFWNMAKAHYPSLSKIALKLLRIPASSASLERLFSQWSFVHNKLRNRLSFEVSKKLLFIYYSLKLKDSNKCDDY